MLGETIAALGGVKSAIDIARTIVQAKTESERLAAVGDLQSALIDIQQQTLSMQAKLAELQDEAIRLRRENEGLRDKAADLSRYQLMTFPETKANAYELKLDAQSVDEPKHYLCSHCYQKGQKSIMQEDGRSLGCPACGLKIYTSRMPPIQYPSGWRT